MSDQIIATLRELVGAVKGDSLEDFPADQSLELDSIARITLIAELENEFDIAIDTESMEPEVFESLNSLSGFIASTVA